MSDGQARILKYVTLLQHGSATFLSVFLAVHVSAPAVALIGGSASASNVMVRVLLVCLLVKRLGLRNALFLWPSRVLA